MRFVGYFCPQKGENQRQEGIKRLLVLGHKRAENIPHLLVWDTPNGKMGHPKRRFGVLGHE